MSLAAPPPIGLLPGPRRVVALCGGIGGAKLAVGLDAVLAPGTLTIVVNTGDDFEHLGLHVCPDLDTVMYTLAGVADPIRGWGRSDESWHFMDALRQLGGEDWFSLGDRDLATHVERTRRLRAGETLTTIVTDMARRLGVGSRILPMTDDPVRTIVHTIEGPLPFQEYFVRRRCAPAATKITFAGAANASVTSQVTDALADPCLDAIVICPSNPYLSIDPMLALPGLRPQLQQSHAPVVAVSPVIGGAAVKGPTAKLMGEFGIRVDTAAITDHYRGVIDGLVIDDSDAADAHGVGVPVAMTHTLMQSIEDRRQLAHAVLQFANRIRRERTPTGRAT